MSTAWYVVKRMAHAVGWLWILAIPTALVTEIVGDLFSETWIGTGTLAGIGFVALCLVVGANVVVAVLVWVSAVRRRWSLKWPLIIAIVVLWPFGFTWVMMIGLGKLIIYAVGRGSTLAGSNIYEPEVVEARPRGMVEYADYN